MPDEPTPNPNTDTRPKRGRPPGSSNRPKTATKTEVESIIGRTVVQINVGLAICSRFLPGTILQEDLLTGQEMATLTEALSAEALANDRLRNIITAASKASPHVQLATAIFVIALPRLVNHGLLPSSIFGRREDAPGHVPGSEPTPEYPEPPAHWQDAPPPTALPPREMVGAQSA